MLCDPSMKQQLVKKHCIFFFYPNLLDCPFESYLIFHSSFLSNMHQNINVLCTKYECFMCVFRTKILKTKTSLDIIRRKKKRSAHSHNIEKLSKNSLNRPF